MNKSLRVKTLVIIGTLLIFLWGIFFGAAPKDSFDAMKKASAERGVGAGILAGIQQNIHLGLDLKGGIHLILQVMADEAVGTDAQLAVDRLQTALRARNIPFTEAAVDPSQVSRIVVKGVPPEQSSAVRDI